MDKSTDSKEVKKNLGVNFNKSLNEKGASSKAASKVIVIGLDAALITSIWRLTQQGKLQNMKKLIDEGVWAENCLVPHPPITPPNWTTIVTGAWPGTHGITGFHVHKPGTELDKVYQAFFTQDCQAEYIWQSAEKVGKKSIIMNYPTTCPPTIKQGIQIAGAGLHINEWRINPDAWSCTVSAAEEQLISTEEYPFCDLVELKPAKDWLNLHSANKFLEAKVKVGYRRPFRPVEPQEWWILIFNSQGREYDTVAVSKTKDYKNIMFSIKVGEWSKKIYTEFKVNGENKKIAFMAKLIELSPDAEKLRLYFTEFCQLDGFSYPEDIAKELENIDGLPGKADGEVLCYGWYDLETWYEKTEFTNIWLAEAAYYLLTNHTWDMFFMHEHSPDTAYHVFMNKLDPLVCKDKDTLTKYQKIEESVYQSLDRMIGRILQAADERTLVMIVSDHGATSTEGAVAEGLGQENNAKRPELFNVHIDKILEQAGLLVFKQDKKKDQLFKDLYQDDRTIDWTRTKAISQRVVYIYVNLKGRDPHGIVEPQDYDRVRDEVINALYDYTDPQTGKKPIVFALKKEDARMIGLYGDRVGDIVYGVRPEVGFEHGRQLPTAEYGVTSMKGLLIMCGPNIKKNYILKRTVWLTDIVPTICYLLDIPVPKNAEGGIIYQALENPDFKYNQLKKLQENYERMKMALGVQKSLTHEYK